MGNDMLSGICATIMCIILIFFASPALGEKLATLSESDSLEVNKLIEKMTLEEKIGQMFIIGFNGADAKGEIEELIRKHYIGGVILYEWNIKNMRPKDDVDPKEDDFDIPKSVAELTNDLQALADKTPRHIPLFIAADQENGACLIVERGITILPGNMSLGHTRDETLSLEAGRITGQELRAMGINMDLAPVVDVNTNKKNDIIAARAFGGHPDIVKKLGTAFMKGLHEGGAIAVGKHFPGHGDTGENPVYTLPKINYELQHMKEFTLPPFESLIENGIEAIMTAHMVVPKEWEPQKDWPVTFSEKVTKMMRDSMGLKDKIIMTDDLTDMGAIRKKWSVPEAVELSIKAGNDIILLGVFWPRTNYWKPKFGVKEFTELLENLAKEYDKPEYADRINESVKRILLLKKRLYKEFDAKKVRVSTENLKEVLRKKESIDTAQRIADSSVVLVTEKGYTVDDISGTGFKNSGPLAPVPGSDPILVISAVCYRPDLLFEELKKERKHQQIESIKLIYGYRNDERETVKKIWGEKEEPFLVLGGSTKEIIERNRKIIEKKAHEIVEKVRKSKIDNKNPIIFTVKEKAHVEVLKRVAEQLKDHQIIAVGLNVPYIVDDEVLDKPNVTFLATGSGGAPSIRALVKVLYGKLPPKPVNHLSVSIEGRFDIRDRDSRERTPIIPIKQGNSQQPPGTFFPQWILFGVVCFFSSLVGAAAKISGQGIASWWVEKKGATLTLGFIPRIILTAPFGVLLYLLAVLGMQIPNEWPIIGPIVSSIKKLPALELIGAVAAGIIGGFLGPSLLEDLLVPFVKKHLHIS